MKSPSVSQPRDAWRSVGRSFLRLWRDDQGQSTTEYILILSVVVMIAMKFKQTFSSQLIQAVQNVGSNIDSITQNDQ